MPKGKGDKEHDPPEDTCGPPWALPQAQMLKSLMWGDNFSRSKSAPSWDPQGPSEWKGMRPLLPFPGPAVNPPEGLALSILLTDVPQRPEHADTARSRRIIKTH